MKQHVIEKIQSALGSEKLAGWLLYDFRASNPVAIGLLSPGETPHLTRRFFYWIPREGEALRFQSAVEPGLFDDLPGRQVLYRGWRELEALLAEHLPSGMPIAMEYSPGGAIPTVAYVDGGTLEWLRKIGLTIVSSANLLQRVEAPWDEAALASHREAGSLLETIRRAALDRVRAALRDGSCLLDVELQTFMTDEMARLGLVTSHPPIVAFGKDSGNPHFGPDARHPRALIPNQVVLIDYWAKLDKPGAVYADYTHMSFAGDAPPSELIEVFAAVRDARDAAIGYLRKQLAAGEAPLGCDVDRVARAVIEEAGYGEAFVHRTGHNLGLETHGPGVNLDSLETRDERRIHDGIAFSIEPGIYLPRFGVRSEVNALNWRGELIVSGELQSELELLA